ncbi:MAG: DUF4405 domain-containing protein [Mangrovibacterium sp.]
MKQKWCDQSKLNLSIDIIMLLLLMPLAGIGFLIKYVLIPGIQRNERYGGDVELEFWGLTRHQWGSVHLIISIVFLVLLLIHIILHWKMIVCIFGRMVPNKTLRAMSATLIACIGFLLIAFPLFVKPEIVTRESLHLNRKFKQETQRAVPRGIREEVSKEAEKDTVVSPPVGLNKPEQALSEVVFADHEINGSQTLQFIAGKYGIPAEKLAADLNIPSNRAGEKLGRLRKQYAFTMDDVRKGILKNKE